MPPSIPFLGNDVYIAAAHDMMLNASHNTLFLQFSMFLLVILNLFSHLVSKSVPQVGCGLTCDQVLFFCFLESERGKGEVEKKLTPDTFI